MSYPAPIICPCSGPYAVTQACVTAVSRVFTPQHQYNQIFPLVWPGQAGLGNLIMSPLPHNLRLVEVEELTEEDCRVTYQTWGISRQSDIRKQSVLEHLSPAAGLSVTIGHGHDGPQMEDTSGSL